MGRTRAAEKKKKRFGLGEVAVGRICIAVRQQKEPHKVMIPSKGGEDTDADSYPTHTQRISLYLWNSRSPGKVKPQIQHNYAPTQHNHTF